MEDVARIRVRSALHPGRLCLKLIFWASETALFQCRLAHAGYVAARSQHGPTRRQQMRSHGADTLKACQNFSHRVLVRNSRGPAKMARRIWKVTKFALLIVLALIVVLAACGLGYRALRQYQGNERPGDRHA